MKIVFEVDKCIGCGTCVALCPEYWEMAEDGKSTFLGAKKNQQSGNYELETEEAGCNQEAVNACPVQCIIIVK